MTKTQKGLLGTKLGMTQVWDADGKLVPVTVIEPLPGIRVASMNMMSPPTPVTARAPARSSARATLIAIATPSIVSNALSRPMRLLLPPVSHFTRPMAPASRSLMNSSQNREVNSPTSMEAKAPARVMRRLNNPPM